MQTYLDPRAVLEVSEFSDLADALLAGVPNRGEVSDLDYAKAVLSVRRAFFTAGFTSIPSFD